ncbi:DUF47 family protein [Sulfurimonas sp. HSL-1716]|uniref:DUF47 domain-containing protein n=1 Tax=Hydrocurvibacter sulfurireducens TaxID=3131937 RepID=UPI0031F7CD03
MIGSFIKKYILPKEVDFVASLQEHSAIIHDIISDLHRCFVDMDAKSCSAILQDEHKAQEIREKNMNELLNAFITPIDRESIYRIISQLDWIAVSIKHFVLEAKAYDTPPSNNEYIELIKHIKEQSNMLNLGFTNLRTEKPFVVASNAQSVRDGYEELVEVYIQKMAELSKSNDMKRIFTQRELLSQLKEIAKRLQICANSLEDIVIKMS